MQIEIRRYLICLFLILAFISIIKPVVAEAENKLPNSWKDKSDTTIVDHFSHEEILVLLRFMTNVGGNIQIGPSIGEENVVGRKDLGGVPVVFPGKVVDEFPILKDCGPYVLVLEVNITFDEFLDGVNKVAGFSWVGSAMTQEVTLRGITYTMPETQFLFLVTGIFNPQSPGEYTVSTHGVAETLRYFPEENCGGISIRNATKGVSPEDGKLPFIVKTRQTSTLVEEPSELNFAWDGADTPHWKIQVESKYGYKRSASYELVADTETQKTKSGQVVFDLNDSVEWKNIHRDPVRAKKGRNQDPVKIIFKAKFPDNPKREPVTRTIKQWKGDPYYSVIRQEYEDAKVVEYFEKPDNLDPDKFASEFGSEYKRAAGSMYYDLTSTPWEYDHGKFLPVFVDNIDAVTKAMRSDYDGWKFDLASVYRNPAYNATLYERGKAGRGEQPSGDSQHQYGFATDVIKKQLLIEKGDRLTKKERELKTKQFKLFYLLKNKYARSFYGNTGPYNWLHQDDPHINWEFNP